MLSSTRDLSLAQPLTVAGADRAARFDGDQGEEDADDQIDGKQKGGKEGMEKEGEPKRHAGKKEDGEHRPDGVGEEKLDGLNIRDGDVEDIALFTVDQTGRGEAPQGLKEMDAHVGEQMISAGVGDNPLDVAAEDNQNGRNPHQDAVKQGGTDIQFAGAGEQEKGAETHQPHLGKVADDAGQRGEGELAGDRGGQMKEPAGHLADRIAKTSTHRPAPPLRAFLGWLAPPPSGSRALFGA